MTEKEIEEKKKEKSRPLLLWLYASVLCGMFLISGICFYYGWLEPREDAKLSSEEFVYVCMLMCGIISTMTVSRCIDMYDNLHPKVRLMIKVWEWVVLIVCIVAVMDVIKKDDIDWVGLAAWIGVLIAFAVVWTWFIKHKGKDGKSTEDRIIEKDKAARIKWYDRHEVYESRSDMGLEIPGHTTIQWDGRRSYLSVKNHTVGFCFAMCLITALMVVGMHTDDVDLQVGVFFACYILGIVMLRGFIADCVNYAVLHTAIPYGEGVRYKLSMIAAYTLVGIVLSNVVFESKPGYECWDIWGYVITIGAYVILFFLTFLMMNVGNRNKGHEFAFFDMDGYEKRKHDPREEEKDEKE